MKHRIHALSVDFGISTQCVVDTFPGCHAKDTKRNRRSELVKGVDSYM